MKIVARILYISGIVLILGSIAFAIIERKSANSDFSNYYHGDYNKIFKKMLTAAEKGDSDAQASIGNLYASGLGIKRDYKEAYYWYKKAADQNNSEALCSIGLMYRNGTYLKQSDLKAIECYKKALEIDRSNLAAEYDLSLIYLNSTSGHKDIEKGLTLLKDAAEKENSLAQSQLGFSYYLGLYNLPVNYERAFSLLRASAEQGDPIGQNNLAVIYYEGKATSQNDFESYKWFYISANYGKYSNAWNAIKNLSFTLTETQKQQAKKEAEQWMKTHKEMNAELSIVN